MKLVAVTEVRYAAVNLFPGDEFEASDSDALVLKAIGKARDAKPAAKPAKVEQKVEAPVEEIPQENNPTSPRRYLRRDMVSGE